jgi:stage IV sporulation protein FB
MGYVLRFRLRGIPVEVEPSFWLASVALASGLFTRPHMLLIWVAVVFFSVLLHEMGHALMARRLHQTPAITLNMMGGQAQIASFRGLTSTGDILVSLAGPVAGFVVGLPLLVLLLAVPAVGEVPVLGVVVRQLVTVNIAWGLLNCLPVLPLDGGQVMLALLRKAGVANATRAAQMVTIGVGGVGAILALVLGRMDLALVGAFLAGHAFTVLRGMR